MIFLGEDISFEYSTSEPMNPRICAEYFATIMERKGFVLNFSLESLEIEIDKILEKYSKSLDSDREILEDFLTSYIGESLIRLFGGDWDGNFYGPLNRVGVNFYTSYIIINDFRFNPNHFIGYYFSNGKKSEGTFYDYLYKRDESSGIFRDFLGGGLIKKINNNIQ
ncbi:hypothetical protein PGH12_05020 [Chryseobacterium wangxinyae]|uniref:hypothetical protein n=1 Tax=Chryseobacterium sp. CY350 TaxID=2997336 RepID=UPI00226F518D|nr:hypothetical protein [Chryseobacterium sp. CY350]MCY0976508.1 hypothetical protein [Chryseobacterium sp. CY350]WBZ96512.1 hypothetical protein PGH12_05020 [Chryseobacterium sp. CY350]